MPKQKMYFQWQNEALLKTIYPLRTMNLRNALEYYMEIDIWNQLKNKKVEDMPREVAAYHAKKATVIRQANQDYDSLKSYFYETEIEPEEAKLLDENMLGKIEALHDAFKKYYEGYTDPFRQSYFITQRLATLDKDRKDLDKRVSTQLRRLNIVKEMNSKDTKKIATEEEALEKLRRTQPVFEERRKKLVELISAFGKLEGRKKDFIKQREGALKQKKEIDGRLTPLHSKIASREATLGELQREARRIRQSIQPGPDSIENYFAVPDALTEMSNRFPQADPEFCRQVDDIREEIATQADAAMIRAKLKDHISNLELKQTQLEKQADSSLKENTLRAFEEVLDQMQDFLSSLGHEAKPTDGLKKVIEATEQKIEELLETLTGLRKDAQGLEEKLNELQPLILDEHGENYLSEYRPVQPTMKDIVELKLDEYRESTLYDHGKEKDQYQLLELLIDRFEKEPERFPRWLQYMIVHFSGMRYASAHGSWADPRDLYLSLRISALNKELSPAEMDDFAVAELCRRKIVEYTDGSAPASEQHELSPFARAEDAVSREKIEDHLALLQKEDAYSRRRGLLNLMLDEESYEAEQMTEQQALEALEDLREKKEIPDWMWKEISALTDLRLTEAKDTNWEKLTPEEQAEKNSAQWTKYRDIMNKWKQDHLTGWREEHDRSNELIVSRAVCNEVAEHILHLRGHHGPSGLSSAQDWFVNAAKKDEELLKKRGPGNDVSYFIKPEESEDAQYYRPGAGILWLKYRNDQPPLWNVVKPFKTTRGETLLPQRYLNFGQWSYKDNGLFRSRAVTNDKGMSVRRAQYLYWVHIATVAEVAKPTEDTTIVLTYETNLPYEDRRLACVGVFKRYLHNLLHDGGEDMYNASYVGYVPDNPPDIPTEDLDEMLNWDHVLLKTKRKKTGTRGPKE